MIGRIYLGRYQTVRLLGEGGMGRVYLAKQLDLGRQVVVKVMHDHIAADPAFQERFQRETLVMARFQHPYAVTLYDASLNDQLGPCIVMEYIKGMPLDTLLTKNNRLSAPRVGRLLGQICEVLQAAHSDGILHRDLKPANIMVVDPDTPYEKVKVMDFGLATLIDKRSLKKLTDTNADFAVGTPGYMCPEQVRGENVDQRGDLYSIGVIMYELLTGKQPFAGRNSMDTMLAQVSEDPPTFANIGGEAWVSPEVEAVVRMCLAKAPAERPPNARDLAERFEIAIDHEQVIKQQTLPTEDPRSPDHPHPELPEREFPPNAIVHQLDAWMPEKIAACKLRGFFQDVGGEVLESVPGRLRVRLGGRGTPYESSSGHFSWFGLKKNAGQIEMDLYMEQLTADRSTHLQITVALVPCDGTPAADLVFRERCKQIFCDLRGYLMGSTAFMSEAAS